MRILLSVLAFAAMMAPALAQERNWQTVRDVKGVYAALLPGKPDFYNEKNANGEAAGHNVELDGGSLYYDIYWTDAPKVPQDKTAHASYLKMRIEESVAAANGSVLSYRPMALGSFIGAEAIVDFPAMGGRLRQRHFVVDQRLVQQTWSGPPGGETTPEVDRFFESLKLKP
jgi:hypothetical protein